MVKKIKEKSVVAKKTKHSLMEYIKRPDLKPFTKDSVVSEIIKRPGAMEILVKYNLPCLHCPLAKFELGSLTIGQVAKMYGISLEAILKDLNQTSPKK